MVWSGNLSCLNVVSSEVWNDEMKSCEEELNGICEGAAKAEVSDASSAKALSVVILQPPEARSGRMKGFSVSSEKLFPADMAACLACENRGE